jgi:hypothetical protein
MCMYGVLCVFWKEPLWFLVLCSSDLSHDCLRSLTYYEPVVLRFGSLVISS